MQAARVHFSNLLEAEISLDILVPFRSAKYNYQCGLLYFAERNGTRFSKDKCQSFHLKTINRYLIVQENKLVIDDKPNFLKKKNKKTAGNKKYYNFIFIPHCVPLKLFRSVPFRKV